MHRAIFFRTLLGFFAFSVLAVFVPRAHAGPPLICWPFDIGEAKTLPWSGSTWAAAKADYDLSRLPKDTLALLTPTTPVIVRMETLRRATVYVMKDRRIASELLARLQARLRDAEAKGKPDPLALFDVGYLVEAYKQARWPWVLGSPAGGLDGYTMIQKAIHFRGGDAEMEFAAALASTGALQKFRREAHLQKAAAGAAEGSLLGKNLVTHCHLMNVRASNVAELRAQLGNPKN
jgi:hypothetical protein